MLYLSFTTDPDHSGENQHTVEHHLELLDDDNVFEIKHEFIVYESFRYAGKPVKTRQSDGSILCESKYWLSQFEHPLDEYKEHGIDKEEVEHFILNI